MSAHDYLSSAQQNAAYGYKGVAMSLNPKFDGKSADDPESQEIGEQNPFMSNHTETSEKAQP